MPQSLSEERHGASERCDSGLQPWALTFILKHGVPNTAVVVVFTLLPLALGFSSSCPAPPNNLTNLLAPRFPPRRAPHRRLPREPRTRSRARTAASRARVASTKGASWTSEHEQSGSLVSLGSEFRQWEEHLDWENGIRRKLVNCVGREIPLVKDLGTMQDCSWLYKGM